jgi:hypothetical protein
MERGAYTDPKAYSVDYSVISEASNKAMEDVGKSMLLLQKQRQEAYDRLQNAYAEYEDDTYLERAKGLDEAQNQAIRESVDVSLVDFSNMSQSEKQKNIEYVKDIKVMQKNLEGIITMAKNQEVTLDAGVNPKWNLFAADLAAMKNIEIRKKDKGLGFYVVHKPLNENGEPTGEEEVYDESKVNNIASMIRDVTPVLNDVEDTFDIATAQVQANIDEWAKNGRRPSEKDIEKWMNTALDAVNSGLTDQKRGIYFTNMVEKGLDFVPNSLPLEGGGERQATPKEKEAMKLANIERFNQKTKEYIQTRLKEKLPVIKEPKEDKDTGSGQPTQVDLNNVNAFDEAYENMISEKNTKYMNPFFTSLGYDVLLSKGGDKLFVYKKDINYNKSATVDSDLVDDSAASLKKLGISRENIIEIPLGDPNSKRIFFDTYRNMTMSEKKSISDNYSWSNYLNRALDNQQNREQPTGATPSSGKKDVSKMSAAEKIEYYKNLK